MTSKESVKLAYTEFQKDFDEGEETNQWLRNVIEGLKQAEKNLEILELLKNRISLKENTIKGIHFTINEKGLPEIETDITKAYDVAFIEASGFVFKNSKEYTLLKEWLENE